MSENFNFLFQTFDSISQFLDDCSRTKNLKATKRIHAHLLRTGLLFASLNIHAELFFTYATCLKKNNQETLTKCFKSVKSKDPLLFNVIISNFCRNGFAFPALKTLSFMHFNGVALDTYALCSSLKASSFMGNVKFGEQIHTHVRKSGWLSSVFVGSALIDLYAKFLQIDNAAVVFDEIPVKNTVCANALLSGYGETTQWVEGLELVRKMPGLNLDYDHFTLSAMLRACAGLSAIELGRQVHAYLIRNVYDVGRDMFLQSALIETYGKCGLVAKAFQVFNLLGLSFDGQRKRDVVLWTSMLGVYGRNGDFKEVILLYEEMLKENIKPDEVAFVTVMSACGHSGQVKLGTEYFESMTREYKLVPGPEHYTCLVGLLCRTGELDKAWKVVNEMLHKGHGNGSVSMWGALLTACQDHGNIELGKFAAKKALELDPQNVSIYVLLSNLYAKYGMWDEIGLLRELMKHGGLKKDAGCSWIEVTG
ncbi:hypothetical protein SLE2022_200380 [Rubroshorea leprosula]